MQDDASWKLVVKNISQNPETCGMIFVLNYAHVYPFNLESDTQHILLTKEGNVMLDHYP